MAVLTERASKGNAKAVEALCLGERGFVCWLISLLNGSYDAVIEKRIWESFLGYLKDGRIAVGDSVEKDLIGCAVSAFTGNSYEPSKDISGNSYLNTIKFPGDIDSARGYINRIIEEIPAEVIPGFLLAISGFDSVSAASILGVDEGEATSSLSSALEITRDTAKKLAGGKYNINIPAAEMIFDILARISASFSADIDPDDEIKTLISQGFSVKPQETEEKDDSAKRPKMIRNAVALLCVILLVICGGIFLKKKAGDQEGGTGTYDGSEDIDHGDDTEEDDVKVIYRVSMEIKDYGTIELELDRSAAPRTVKNFVDLVKRGFYDGLTFHRIMDGFMIQGGDPLGNGTGGSDKKIIGEFSANGVDNPISHTRGTISMARASNDYNSARSQFFICQVDCSSSLDGKYAAFGHVTSGMEIVDQICKDAKPTDDNGTIPKDQQPVIVSVTVTTEFETE